MTRSRIATAIFLASVLAALAVSPLTAHGATVAGHGTATGSLTLIDVTLDNVPEVGSTGASAGNATTQATTVGDSSARVLLDAIGAAGQSQTTHEASSDDGTTSQDAQVPLSGPGVTGMVTAAELLAEASPESALGLLRGLAADIDIATLGLSAGVSENGMRAEVSSMQASSRTGASLGRVDLTLGDLLPAGLLEELPLSVLIDLVESLDLDLGLAADQIAALQGLGNTLDEVQVVLDDLAAAEADLLAALGDDAALVEQVQAAQAAVDDAQTAVDTLETQVADLESQVSALSAEIAGLNDAVTALEEEKNGLVNELALCVVPSLCNAIQAELDQINAAIAAAGADLDAAQADLTDVQGQLDARQAELTSAQADLAEAQAALTALLAGVSGDVVAALQSAVDDLQAQLTDLLGELQAVLGSLPDLSDIVDGVVALLSDAPLLRIDDISVSAVASADSESGTAELECVTSGVQVAGRDLGGLSCATFGDAFDEVEGVIEDVLGQLPGGSSFEGATIEGLETSTQASDQPDESGTTSAVASLTALHVAVPSLSLQDVVDAVVEDLIAEINALTADLPADAEVSPLLDELQAQLAGLPTGDSLAGVRTVGMDATVLGMMTRASFVATPRVVNPDPDVDPENAPDDDPNDGSDDGAGNDDGDSNGSPVENRPPTANPGPGESRKLPLTGSSLLPLLATALWLAVAGVFLMFFTEHRVVIRVEPRPGS